jgi:hypothetical protein
MKLTKNKVLELMAALVILAAFNVIFFALPLERGLTCWIAYGFSMLSIVVMALTTLYVLWRGDIRSKFYGLPVLYVSWIYATVQIVLGFIFILVPLVPFWVEFPVNTLLLAACLLGLSSASLGAGEVRRIDEAVREKVFYIQSLRTEAETMAAKAAGGNVKKALNEYAEAIRYSDPMSSPELAELENILETKTALLREQVGNGNAEAALSLCGELRQLLKERNRQCKLLKQAFL